MRAASHRVVGLHTRSQHQYSHESISSLVYPTLFHHLLVNGRLDTALIGCVQASLRCTGYSIVHKSAHHYNPFHLKAWPSMCGLQMNCSHEPHDVSWLG